jgi:hypothetical protein
LKEAASVRHDPRPQWDGRPLNGQSILIHTEQGFGDAIQFCRYLPFVSARGGRVFLRSRPELVRLLRCLPNIEIVTNDAPIPQCDTSCSLLSLPLIFKTRLDSIPATVPFLRVEPDLLDAWKRRIDACLGRVENQQTDHNLRNGKDMKIGLAWAGSPTHTRDRKRSIALDRLAPLAQVPGVTFFSLQKNAGGSSLILPPAGMTWIDITAELTDFADTAALISHLDLVISVDTSIVHLAGALGKPVWVLLPFFPDWRWLLDREDSPWYPTVRLFRQKTIGDWTEVIQRVVGDLAALNSPS